MAVMIADSTASFPYRNKPNADYLPGALLSRGGARTVDLEDQQRDDDRESGVTETLKATSR
jgi:hypothetical protein